MPDPVEPEADTETAMFDDSTGHDQAGHRLDWETQAWIHRRLAAFAVLAVLAMGAVVGAEMHKTASLFRSPHASWHVGMGHLRMDEEHEGNPYMSHPLYRSPRNRAGYDTAISRRVASGGTDPQLVPSALWIDSKAKVRGRSLSSLEGILEDASWRISRELVTLVMHNLPNRGCDKEAPKADVCCSRLATGECDYMAATALDCAEGLREYRQEFVDPIVDILQKFKATFPVAVVLEPGSAAGLVGRPGMAACRGATTRFAYREGLQYAVQQLVEKTPWVTIYLDGGHGGWLGSHGLVVAYFQALKGLQLPTGRIRGFATNVGSQRPLGEAACPWKPVNTSNAYCLLGRAFDPCCEDPCETFPGGTANSELNFAQELAHNAWEILKMKAHMIIDTSRNGQLAEGARKNSCGRGPCGTEAFPGMASTAKVHPSASSFLDAYFWVAHPLEFQACDFPLPAQEAHGSSFSA